MKKPCPYCQTASALYFRSRDYNLHITEEVFEHYRCPGCGLIFISPTPANLGSYYPQTYYAIPQTVRDLEAKSAPENYKIDIIKRYVNQGRLLEIGPSFGAFSYRAKQAGFETEAIEMSEKCSVFLKEVVGIPTVNTTDIKGAIHTLKAFDVIAMWHVIEHLPNPFEVLEEVSKKINAGGILILAAPNPDSFQFHVLGRRWVHLDAPRHLMLIPQRLLTDKMAKLGLKMEFATTKDEGTRECDVTGWTSFFSSFSNHPRLNQQLRNLGYRITRLVSPIEKKEGKGSAYTIVFRKVT